jgi:hypothetical protein
MNNHSDASNTPAGRRNAKRTFGLAPFRRNIKANRLENLPGHQLAKLNKWLFSDNLSYAKIQELLWQEFQVKTTSTALCLFWQKKTRPAVRPAGVEKSNVLLDVIVQSTRPIRLTILRNQIALHTRTSKVKLKEF